MTSLTWDRHKGHAGSYDVMRAGFNYRLDELRAALGRVQLSKLMRNNQRRRALLAEYREHLTSLEDWGMPFAHAIADSSGHLMVAVAPNGTIRSRAVQALRDAGIQSSLHYPSIADFTGYQGISAEPLALTRAYTSRAITLPLYPDLDPVWIPEIVAILRTAS
jgi:dTDP-4-amino-4,6-dideoxygalactose transaminase